MVHGFFWVLLRVLGIFFGFDFCPNSIIPVTRNPEYAPTHRDATWVQYIFPYITARDTAGWLIEHRKLTLPLLASPAGVFRGDWEEIRSPLKTPAGEATSLYARGKLSPFSLNGSPPGSRPLPAFAGCFLELNDLY